MQRRARQGLRDAPIVELFRREELVIGQIVLRTLINPWRVPEAKVDDGC